MVCLQALNDFQTAQRQAASKEKEALKKARADSDAQYFGECLMAHLDLAGKVVSCVRLYQGSGQTVS